LDSNTKFMNEEQIKRITEAYFIIKEVKESISLEHKEFFVIDSILDKLDDAINYKKYYD